MIEAHNMIGFLGQFNFINPLSFENDTLFIFQATARTILITFVSVFLGTLLGFFVGLIKLSPYRPLRWLATAYIEPFRNTPVLAQLFLIFFGLPMLFQVDFSEIFAAILGLTLNTAAFVAVIVHSSISAISKGQWETAKSLGHGSISSFIYVIFPQALRLYLPPAVSLYVTQLQVSSVVALIYIVDLTQAGRLLTQKSHQPFLTWGIIMLIYFSLSFPLSRLAKRLEKHLHKAA